MFCTKTTYSPLLSEKFGGSAAPSRPHYASPMLCRKGLINVKLYHKFMCLSTNVHLLSGLFWIKVTVYRLRTTIQGALQQ
ncbi:hypothetical protein Hanom_Chr15g01354571 [Helianthus anomalus]